MTDNLRTDNKISRKYTDNFSMDKTNDIKRLKATACFSRNYFSSRNSMQFEEISPLNSINIPHPRSGHRAVATESDFWIWGGYHPSPNNQSPMFNEV
jgi:hypothetical protein